MKHLLSPRWAIAMPFLVIFGTCLIAGILIATNTSRHQHSHKIHFVEGRGLYYIWAHEYRGHWLIDDRLVIETDQGPIELSVAENPTLAREIEAKRAAGVLPDPARN